MREQRVCPDCGAVMERQYVGWVCVMVKSCGYVERTPLHPTGDERRAYLMGGYPVDLSESTEVPSL